MANTVVKAQIVPNTVSGHLLTNSTPSVASAARSRHAMVGQQKAVAVQLGTTQPNTDRRRYVTHR